ncbi:MAG: MGMT family protein [Lysobacteraceae bacterium]
MPKPRHDLPTRSDSTHQQIRDAIYAIPRGEVRAYSDIALAAGLPGRARLVARVLAESDASHGLPWHRVLRADGRIAFPRGSEAFDLQCKRLLAEGVNVRDGRVRLQRAASLDAALWRP